MPVMFGVDEVISGVATAVLAPATTKDSWRSEPGANWKNIAHCAVGDSVFEVWHFAGETHQQGQVITLTEIRSRLSVRVMITEMKLVRANQLTKAERAELGSGKTSERIGVNLIDSMGDRRGWFMRIIPVTEEIQHG